jgi:Pentapeptide repeats (8 copies)
MIYEIVNIFSQKRGRINIMANKEHLEILKKGVKEWNKWREDNPEIVPDLKEAHLRIRHLEGARLDFVLLDGAILIKAHLEGADLSMTYLNKANLNKANLTGANLRGAHLKGADLSESNLKGAVLLMADLEGADLRYCKKLILDSTYIRDARFSSFASDNWSILRRKYSGHRMFLNLLLLVLFILPYTVKTVGLVGLNRMEKYAWIQTSFEKIHDNPIEIPLKKTSSGNEQNKKTITAKPFRVIQV